MTRIQKKKTKTPENRRKQINICLAVFAISIVVFTVIGALVMDNFSNLQPVEDLSSMDEDTYKGEIDDRLRFIAMQDDDASVREKESSDVEKDLNEPEEVLNFINGDNEEVKKNKFEQYNETHQKKTATTAQENSMEEIPYKKDVTATPMNLKVVIGNFDTKEAAQEELLQIRSQFTAPPFIKYVNGRYSLQVASFKTPETAYEFVNSLRHQGYNARVIEE